MALKKEEIIMTLKTIIKPAPLLNASLRDQQQIKKEWLTETNCNKTQKMLKQLKIQKAQKDDLI